MYSWTVCSLSVNVCAFVNSDVIQYTEWIYFSSILDSGLVGLVQPMLWDYSPTMDVAHNSEFVFLLIAVNCSKEWHKIYMKCIIF